MSRRPLGRGSGSGLPVPVYSRGSPANSTTSSQGLRGRSSLTHSTEDVSKQYGSSLSPASAARRAASPAARRSVSPGQGGRRLMLSPARRQSQTEAIQQPGVRYITEDLIRKVAKEDNFDLITSLNLTLTKEGGKKIKYIENLDKLRKLQTLNLSHNLIEKVERLDKLLKLRDLSLADNMLTRIEGLENLVVLQSLNLSDNRIEHVPQWLGKKLKALRTFRIARNCLESLSEMAKLKPLPDLIQLDVAGNPLSDLPHGRLYVVFHLRTVEILDGQTVSDIERRQAQQRFEQEEVEQLEKRLEQEESKVRQLEESHNKSLQERSLQQTSASELASKERDLQDKMKQLQQQLAAKDDLLKKKTSDLNKASQKHYELEQELAFYKIDSKFDSLNEAPKFTVESADDSGDLQESPYIGRARYRANQFAHESSGGASPSPQRASVVHSARRASSLHSPGGGILRRSLSPPSKAQAQAELDMQLEQKHAEVQKTEAKLRALQDDLSATERKLMNATTELKKISTDRVTPEPFRDDNKYKIRQRLARKMQKVNELRNQATQMEEDIDRKHEKITQDRADLHRLQSQLSNTDPNSYGFERKQKEVQDKETQINESSRNQVELQKELEEALTNIARETTDIKNLEEQLAADQIEQNDELRHELDDIVCGLSGYLENVKGQSRQHKHEFEMLIAEKEALEEKIRRMEGELNILEGEASNARWMQKRLSELEDSLRKTEDLNTTLQDEVERNRQRDPEVQDRLKRAEEEAKQLRQTLHETEKKAEAERKATQKQIQSERERADKMTQKIQDVNRQELETKKLMSQLEAAKALNAGLRDQVEEFRHKQQMEEGGFKPSDLKKRLKKFTHEFKTNKNPIEPQGKNDYLGLTFQDLQKHTQEQLDNSTKELQDLKKEKQKAEAEIQTLKEKMKKVASKAEATKEEKKAADDNRRLQDEIRKLKKALEDAKARNSEGAIPVRIVYRPDSENGADRASSLNSDEKMLFDELQRELMDLKRNMRSHEDDLSKRLVEAETEAAQYKEEMKQKEKEFEAEMEEHRQAAELMRSCYLDVLFVMREGGGWMEVDGEGQNAAQEDELARLYDILETQRDEIENLNQILDHLAQQGPDGVGAGFDDELWRIRQEVNNLKETLAMQSAYVQAMPGVGHMATQAGIGAGPDGVGGGSGGFFPQQAAGQGSPVRASGAAAGTQVAGRPFGSVPTIPSKGSSGQANTTGATGRTPGGHQSASGRVARPGSTQMAGAAMASTPMPRSAQV
ncbi:centriolin [Plakobranchus ocellatus]|uniref:Centriolin n=1 Tax=Plakobranchus ocellatus TaxID=259542 RepID=A0AAV4ASK9_9GAST|nr:centriolin [Plakobranchus ocellatus]